MSFDKDLKRKISENIAETYEELCSVNKLYDLSREPTSMSWDGKKKHEHGDIIVNSSFTLLGVSVSVTSLYRCVNGRYNSSPTLVKLLVNE